MKWLQRALYALAAMQYLTGEYVRWIEGNRPEAGYWLACAIISFLLGHILVPSPK